MGGKKHNFCSHRHKSCAVRVHTFNVNFFPSRLMHYSYKKQYPFVFSLDLLNNKEQCEQTAALSPSTKAAFDTSAYLRV